MADNLFITLEQRKDRVFDDEYPAMKIEFAADLEDSTVHEWFMVFEKVLAASGFSERVIMKGACQLAFNQLRNQKDMVELYDEYDLKEFDRSGTLPGEE